MSGFLIQSHFGSMGNFEVVVPSRAAGGLVHFWRNNDDPGFPLEQAYALRWRDSAPSTASTSLRATSAVPEIWRSSPSQMVS